MYVLVCLRQIRRVAFGQAVDLGPRETHVLLAQRAVGRSTRSCISICVDGHIIG
jgi:hypothetical protein